MSVEDKLWDAVAAVRAKAPLVQCLTNFVSMDIMANGLLAIGASPVMVHATGELDAAVPIVGGAGGAVSINIGTLDERWIQSFEQTVKLCKDNNVPWVLDPVAAGFTPLRTEIAIRLMEISPPAVLRGNASEIMALAGAAGGGKGVDSTQGSDAALEAAKSLASRFSCVVCISGATDYVVGPTLESPTMTCPHGHEMLTKVTACGCLLSSVIAAFVCSRPETMNIQESAVLACTYYCLAAEVANRGSAGPGTFRVNFLDCLYSLSKESTENITLNTTLA
mmetsp:Transcript_86953/g.218858  ORF Transcript_86953/g.218858 Transcript_86953/m.218858 type:complete len:279 (-) Transcript_86953:303-1139(-)